MRAQPSPMLRPQSIFAEQAWKARSIYSQLHLNVPAPAVRLLPHAGRVTREANGRLYSVHTTCDHFKPLTPVRSKLRPMSTDRSGIVQLCHARLESLWGAESACSVQQKITCSKSYSLFCYTFTSLASEGLPSGYSVNVCVSDSKQKLRSSIFSSQTMTDKHTPTPPPSH